MTKKTKTIQRKTAAKRAKAPKPRPIASETCNRKGCKEPVHAREMCLNHYQADWRLRTGRTEFTLESREPPRLALGIRVNGGCYKLLEKKGRGYPGVAAREVLETWAKRQSAA